MNEWMNEYIHTYTDIWFNENQDNICYNAALTALNLLNCHKIDVTKVRHLMVPILGNMFFMQIAFFLYLLNTTVNITKHHFCSYKAVDYKKKNMTHKNVSLSSFIQPNTKVDI